MPNKAEIQPCPKVRICREFVSISVPAPGKEGGHISRSADRGTPIWLRQQGDQRLDFIVNDLGAHDEPPNHCGSLNNASHRAVSQTWVTDVSRSRHTSLYSSTRRQPVLSEVTSGVRHGCR